MARRDSSYRLRARSATSSADSSAVRAPSTPAAGAINGSTAARAIPQASVASVRRASVRRSSWSACSSAARASRCCPTTTSRWASSPSYASRANAKFFPAASLSTELTAFLSAPARASRASVSCWVNCSARTDWWHRGQTPPSVSSCSSSRVRRAIARDSPADCSAARRTLSSTSISSRESGVGATGEGETFRDSSPASHLFRTSHLSTRAVPVCARSPHIGAPGRLQLASCGKADLGGRARARVRSGVWPRLDRLRGLRRGETT